MDLYEIAKQEVIEKLEQAYLDGEISAKRLLETIEELDEISEMEFFYEVYSPYVMDKEVH